MFAHNEAVEILTGSRAQQRGTIALLLGVEPDPLYLVALSDGRGDEPAVTSERSATMGSLPSLWKRTPISDVERAADLAAQDLITARLSRRLRRQTLGGCILCCAAGLVLVGLAVHTTDPGWGAIAFWSGLLIGDAGVFALLLRHYVRMIDDGL